VDLVVEDGTGVVGANVYQDDTATSAQLSKLGYATYGDLPEEVRTSVLVLATAAIDSSLRSTPDGVPVNPSQGLYYPRGGGGGGVGRIPESVPLACSLKAELWAIEEHGTDPLVSIPPEVTEVSLAKGVKVVKKPGRVDSPKVRNLRSLIQGLLLAVQPKPRVSL